MAQSDKKCQVGIQKMSGYDERTWFVQADFKLAWLLLKKNNPQKRGMAVAKTALDCFLRQRRCRYERQRYRYEDRSRAKE